MYENIKLQIIYAYLKTDLKLAKQKGFILSLAMFM